MIKAMLTQRKMRREYENVMERYETFKTCVEVGGNEVDAEELDILIDDVNETLMKCNGLLVSKNVEPYGDENLFITKNLTHILKRLLAYSKD